MPRSYTRHLFARPALANPSPSQEQKAFNALALAIAVLDDTLGRST